MRRKQSTVGTGLSAHEQDDTWLDLPDDLDHLRAALAPRDWNVPWPLSSRLIDHVRERRRKYELIAASERTSEFGPDPEFVPRESEGWYLRQLCAFAKIVELAVDGGRHWEAVENAMQFGAMFDEFRLKFEWGKDALRGRQLSQNQADANAQRRQGSAKDRIARVDSYVAAGRSKRWAFHKVGREQGVSMGAVQKDYYKKRPITVD